MAILKQSFGNILTIVSHLTYIMRIMFMEMAAARQGQEDESLPSIDGELVLNDLQTFQPLDAVSPAPRVIAVVAKLLNEIGPAETIHRQGSNRAGALLEGLYTLRNLVEQWIEADKDWQSAQKMQPKTDDPGELERQRDVHRLTWCSPKHETSIFKTLTIFWDRNPPRVVVGGDGRLTINAEPVPSLNPQDLRQDARNGAIWTFQRLLDSRERDLLSRCNGCKRFFVRARAPKLDMSVKHGTFCRKCKGLGGARRTVASREQRKKEMVGWAADCWPKWRPRHGKRTEWIAKQVNQGLDKHHRIHDPITGKWVTQNKKLIEAEVERRNHAKS